MARPASSGKRDNEKKKQSKRLEKQKKKEERKNNNNKGASLEEMFAYVDENGVITSVPPEQQDREEIELEDIIISTPKKVETDENIINKGRVDYFNNTKGYGFIKDIENSNKYFFHISSAPENIKEGDIVFFELERGLKDLNAVKIKFEE